MGFEGSKKKIAIAGFSSILLVAMVVAVTVSVSKSGSSTDSGSPATNNGGDISTSTKAIDSICAPTDYKETCKNSLSSAKNTSDPRELIKVAFNVAEENIAQVIKNSSLLKEAAKDPMTSKALETCKELLETSVDDLKRSFSKVDEFDVTQMEDYVEDLKTWLSAAITYQETCIDGFENTTGDTGEKMKKLLKTASELSSNGLAMVTDISQILGNLQLGGLSRRLLSVRNHEWGGDPTDYPPDSPQRELLSKRNNEWGGDPTDYPPDSPQRQLRSDRNNEWGGDPTDYPPDSPQRESGGLSRRLLSDRNNEWGGDPTDYPPDSPQRQIEIPAFVDGARRKLLAAGPASPKPNAVVAQDGSGTFKTINEALATVPKKNNQTFVIFVKAGIYKETVIIPKKMNKIVLIGEGPTKTRISGSKNYVEGTMTFHTATVAVNADDFTARDIGFENTAGANKHQAVALRISGDKAIVYNCAIDAFQDTLYAHAYRQYYRDCTISGTIDFIFGDAASVFQNCKLVVRKPADNQNCMVTAQGRKDKRGIGAIVLQNCHIVAEPAFLAVKFPPQAFLGRPWKEYSRTIVMQSYIDAFIDPEGWSPWAGTYAIDTCYYGEYQNRGPGSNTANRVTWKGIQKITPQIAESFTPAKYFGGDLWIKPSGFPYVSGMMKV
ncbi:putative pectinesterase/pectinesterase inhibitor 43 [Forsythia ovata]|uniref:Pectinesterase n=1 Tax=Forsythia ovata TaxID=205694 RepID=A0ABD1UZW3_9LAMI